MKRNRLPLPVLAALSTICFCAMTGAAQQAVVNRDKVKRLDGSVITSGEIDATVNRVMKAHLSIQENDEPRQELFAASETVFFSRMTGDELTFEVDAGGHVTRMVLRTGGKEIPIKRIE